MAYVIKRDTEHTQYVSGYSVESGIVLFGPEPKEFTKVSDAKEIAKALNTFALLEDDAYRFEVFKVESQKVDGVVLSEGGKNSAYNKRLGKDTDHEVDIEIEE